MTTEINSDELGAITRYQWTTTGLKPSELEFGQTRYVSEYDYDKLERDLAKANAHKAVLVEALEQLKKALLTDSRGKTILADTVEYHLDGPSMYRAINAARAALSQVQA